jgi:hypothetical protein
MIFDNQQRHNGGIASLWPSVAVNQHAQWSGALPLQAADGTYRR